MFLTEENIKALTNHDFSSIYQDLVEVIKTLENTYNSVDAKIPQAVIEDLLQKVDANKEKILNGESLYQLESGKELVNILGDFRLKNVEALPKNIVKTIESWEKIIIPNLEIRHYLLSVDNAIRLSKNELEKFKTVYTALIGIQKTVEKYVQYFYNDEIEHIKNLANVIIQNYDDYECQDTHNQEAIENYLIAIKNSAKVLLWDINQFEQSQKSKNQTSEKEKFETIDELWEYWLQKYDQDEISQSLETLMEAIDSRRRKQGGRTLFS